MYVRVFKDGAREERREQWVEGYMEISSEKVTIYIKEPFQDGPFFCCPLKNDSYLGKNFKLAAKPDTWKLLQSLQRDARRRSIIADFSGIYIEIRKLSKEQNGNGKEKCIEYKRKLLISAIYNTRKYYEEDKREEKIRRLHYLLMLYTVSLQLGTYAPCKKQLDRDLAEIARLARELDEDVDFDEITRNVRAYIELLRKHGLDKMMGFS